MCYEKILANILETISNYERTLPFWALPSYIVYFPK